MENNNDQISSTPSSAANKTPSLAPTNPWWYIPTLYFAEGVPYILINQVSVTLYTRLGIDNKTMAFWTSWLYLPWVIKMFWGPLIDIVSTKRRWVLATQAAMFVIFSFVTFSLGLEKFFFASLAGFIVGAFLSATHDIAVDGYYLLVLNKAQQAFFVGIRSTFYRLAMIFGSGFLVYTAGKLEELSPNSPTDYYSQILLKLTQILGCEAGNKVHAWSIVFGSVGILFLAITLYHALVLPDPESEKNDVNTNQKEEQISFTDAIISYFRQPQIKTVLAFILLYRFGEAMLVKLAQPFLLAPISKGGMGLLTSEVGIAYGTIGLLSLIFGGILGGMAIAKFGFRKCIWPMAAAMNVPDVFYVYMAFSQPPKYLAYPLIAIEQFGYGFGFTAFTVYLMYICQGVYKTSHFAISTGIMAFGMMFPGFISGYVQELLGYTGFFIVVCIMTIPGFLTIPFILRDSRIDEQTLSNQ